MYKDFSVICRICHWGFTIKKKEKSQVYDILEQGKSATKSSFDKMEKNSRERLLKNLNRNGFKDLAQFFAFGNQVL
jgi:hypothetical protein